ncbi:MAG: ferritin-like domain-containing protein, partial [Pedobacter sp.]|nr:ferritin-like domain-containing protein [Pedobacter sp.]
MKNLNEPSQVLPANEGGILESRLQRRSFLQYAGAGAAALALTAVGCRKDRGFTNDIYGVTLDFKDDFGVLNYAYALEQLEAAFYTQVSNNLAIFTDSTERAYFQDIRAHEVAHREFFKSVLGTGSIGSLTPDFSSIDFNSRTAVLAAAKTFEDLGVAAYNGAGVRIQNAAYLTVAGQIVSVEARHAAAIRDMIS